MENPRNKDLASFFAGAEDANAVGGDQQGTTGMFSAEYGDCLEDFFQPGPGFAGGTSSIYTDFTLPI